ncbi:uncharacterized protein LOC114580031 [Dendrobium catenatum]|uniref:uncharacterized protein LOC114580031 n=1 Tax=Dendrobium catenatum TaxID=906689 RepID=UPI00109FDFE9|nr:uncharacterized protein LOC114580031 [Dendrobium catenatum]
MTNQLATAKMNTCRKQNRKNSSLGLVPGLREKNSGSRDISLVARRPSKGDTRELHHRPGTALYHTRGAESLRDRREMPKSPPKDISRISKTTIHNKTTPAKRNTAAGEKKLKQRGQPDEAHSSPGEMIFL